MNRDGNFFEDVGRNEFVFDQASSVEFACSIGIDEVGSEAVSFQSDSSLGGASDICRRQILISDMIPRCDERSQFNVP